MGAIIDLTHLPSGKRYEDQYGKFLDIFKQVAESKEEVVVVSPPVSWCSLIYYLGGKPVDPKIHFYEDGLLRHYSSVTKNVDGDVIGDINGRFFNICRDGKMREVVEHDSTLRPELVDALYKSDTEYNTVNRRHQTQRMFNVTCNGSFFRPEVLHYINNILPQYTPEKSRCVLCPCAADKPYPAPLHTAILKVLPPGYELIIATGVLGLVPQKLWDVMPLYDSGVPYQWRLMKIAKEFFSKHYYSKIVVYSDFYASSIRAGLKGMDVDDVYVFGHGDMDYLDLLSPTNLARLKEECERRP